MNMLTHKAPDCVLIDGQRHTIRTDFRVGIEAERMMLDGELEQPEGVLRLLSLYFPAAPLEQNAAQEAVLWFYSCGQTECAEQEQGARSQPRVYDYDADAAYIYAAFLADYGIDLETVEHLHWWKFRAMFSALSPSNTLCKIMEYRAADISKFKGEERAFYRKMKTLYALPLRAAQQEALEVAADFLLQH